MKLVSDDIMQDSGKQEPTYERVYPSFDDFILSNPNSFRNHGHPFAFYKKMREQAPVMWQPMRKELDGIWSVSRYEDIKTVELAPHIYSSQRGSINMASFDPEKGSEAVKKLTPAAQNSLINMDAPMHMEMRIQQKDFFIPAYVKEISGRVGQKIDSLLDDLEAAGPEADFAKIFSLELPLFTLCEMLGVDEADRPRMARWMHYLEMASQFLSNPLQTFFQEPLLPFKFKGQVVEMFQYGEEVMADRRANPREDLLSIIANSKIGNELLPQEYLDGSWLLIVFAGNDTTRNSLSGTIKLLTEFPDQKQMVLDDRSLIPAMSQEALRLVSPVQHMRRTALEDTELNGQRIAKDEKVVMWYGAGNRDPEVFPDPDRFDMTRDNVDKHLAFGHGVHKCLGSRIAQMQLRLAYERILDRFPDIHWTGQMKVAPNALVHAISSLKVNLYGPNGTKPTKVQVKSVEGVAAE